MVKFTLKGISNLTESPAYFQQVNGIYRKDGALALAGYEHALLILPVSFLVAFVACLFIKETHCRAIVEEESQQVQAKVIEEPVLLLDKRG